MSHYDQHQAPPGYPPPPPGQGYPPPAEGYPPAAYVAAPPPAPYPVKDGSNDLQQAPPPVETKDRGDGFWRGCCAALCCCCLLDMCF